MNQQDAILTEKFAKQDIILSKTYDNRFTLFESRMQRLLESKQGNCRCYEKEASLIAVVLALEEEIAKLRQEFSSSQVIQQELLKEIKLLGLGGQHSSSEKLPLHSNEEPVLSLDVPGDTASSSDKSASVPAVGICETSADVSVLHPELEMTYSDQSESHFVLPLSDDSHCDIAGTFNSNQKFSRPRIEVVVENESDSVVDSSKVKQEVILFPAKLSIDQPVENSIKDFAAFDSEAVPGIFECKQCDILLVDKKAFQCHMKTKHPDRSVMKRYKCSFCSYSCNRKAILKQHIRIHTKEQPFQCLVCSRKFSQNQNLKKHLLTHSHERSFQCSKCPKSFKRRDDLKVHVSGVHEKFKPFLCKLCGLTFSRRFVLDRHMLSHDAIAING